jgi:hypothetical protein
LRKYCFRAEAIDCAKVSARPNPIGARSARQDLDAGFGVGCARVAQVETLLNRSAFALSGTSSIASDTPAANRLAGRGSITRPSLGFVVVRTAGCHRHFVRPGHAITG